MPSEDIAIFSRLKGDTENDIEDQLSRLGLAVVISPFLPQEYKNYALSIRAKGVIGISVIENVQNNSLNIGGIDIHADNILEAILFDLYDANFDKAPLQFQALDEQSPADEPLVILLQRIELEISL